METNQVFVEVSQHSREAARGSPCDLLDRYQREMAALVAEKQALECRLSDLDAEKRERALKITQKRLHRSHAIEATQRLEVEFNERRKEITNQYAAVNERLQALKKFMLDKGGFREEDQRVILRRIESGVSRLAEIAGRIANLLEAANGR